MLDFQHYQTTFTAHIRDPKANKKPAGVNMQRMAVYRNAVFNNVVESVSVCFPICQKVLSKRAWQQLMRQFLAQHAADTPIFREIPQTFLAFLAKSSQPTPYLYALAHYEWVELAVSKLEQLPANLSKHTDLLAQTPVLAPHILLAYDYAVHQISAKFKPKLLQATYLLVFRNVNFEVKFIELNPITFQLLTLIKEQSLTGNQALTKLAQAMQHPNVNAVIGFGEGILNDLAQQGAIIGSENEIK